MELSADGNNRSDAPRPHESPRDGGSNGTFALQHSLLHPAALPLAPASLSAAPNALTLLQALRRRWLLALTVAVLLAGPAAAAVWFLLPPPKFTAKTTLYVAADPPKLVGERGEAQNRELQELHLAQQAFLIHTRWVLNKALNQPGVPDLPTIKAQADPLQWLEQEVNVEVPNPEYLQIVISGDRPDDLKVLANAVTRAYLDDFLNKDRKQAREREEQLTRKRDELALNLDKQRKALQEAEGNLGPVALEHLPLRQLFAMQDLHSVQNELAQVHRDIWRVEGELGLRPIRWAALLPAFPSPHAVSPFAVPMNLMAASLLGNPALFSPSGPVRVDATLVEQILERDGHYAGLRQEIRKVEMEIEEIKQRTKPAFWEELTQGQQQKLKLLNQELQKHRDYLMPMLIDALRKQGAADPSDEKQLRKELADLQARDRRLQQKAKEFQEVLRDVKQDVKDYVNRKQDIAAVEMVLDTIRKAIALMEVNKDMPSRVIWPDDPAEPNKGEGAVVTRPDATKRKLTATAGTAGATLALVLLAFAWFEFQTRKLRSVEEVVQGLGLQLVGTIPDLSQRAWLQWRGPGAHDATYTQSLLTESVDTARQMVLHTARSEKLQVIMITSALAGEGKTSLASHLAASLARSGRRTLLLDSDLRNPTLHHLFDRSRAPGLSEALRGDTDLAGAIRDTPIDKLWLISAGKADSAALQVLSQGGIEPIFEQLRKDYEFIVVDSCPVLPVADSLLVAQHVDGVIFSLLREVSRLPSVYAAYHRLSLLGVRVLGAVVNGTREKVYGTNYYYVSPEG